MSSVRAETGVLVSHVASSLVPGSVTPRSKSPGSTSVTPVGQIFGTDELADILRSSPGIDLSKLNIKQEQVCVCV